MATSLPPPRRAPPPTRQLFVRFPARRPRSLRDVEELFCEFGRLKHAHLGKSGDVAFVSYCHLEDAREAAKRLDRREHRGYELRVEHSRVTRLLAVGDVPARGVSNAAEAAVREAVAAHGAVEWATYDAPKGTVFVLMRSETEAARAVSELQGRELGGWRWEVEFYKEGSIRPPPARRDSHQAGAAVTLQGTNATPAAVLPTPPAPREVALHGLPAPAVGTAPVAVNAVPHAPLPPPPPPPPTPPPPASAVVGAASSAPTPSASATPAPASGKDDAREPPRSPSPSAQKRRARSQSRSRSRSRSPTRSRSGSRSRSRSRSPRSPSRSPPRKGRRTAQRSRSRSRSASKSPPPSRSAAPSSVSPSVSRDLGRRRRRRSASPDASPPARSPPPPAAPIECAECRRLVTHLSGTDHHSLTEDDQTKQLVKAWFSGNFELASKRDASRKPESIRRLRFLDEHVNPFLESVGLPTWTTRTPLYANWFLREVLRLSTAEVYAERLRRLLADVEKQLGGGG